MRKAENQYIESYNLKNFAKIELNNFDLRNRILNEKLYDRLVSGITYENLFAIADKMYKNESISHHYKLQILDEVYRLRQIAVKDK
jgi:hypothetical protein